MKKLPWILFAAGVILGAVFFFPFRVFTTQIEQALAKQAGIDAQLGDLRIGTGLGLGLGRGGVTALRGTNVVLNFAEGRTITCKEFVLSPQFWTLVMAKIRVTAACKTERDGTLISVVSAGPIWNPSQVDGEIFIQDLKLSFLENLLHLDSFSGTLNGQVGFQMPLNKGPRIPALNWEATGSKVTLPALASDLLNVPSISVGRLSTRGKVSSSGRADIEEFVIGDKNSPVEGNFQGNFTLDRRGMPTGADIKGRLRTDPEFEKAQLKDISLDLLFGKANETGQREFHKMAQGSLLGLIMNPPLDR